MGNPFFNWLIICSYQFSSSDVKFTEEEDSDSFDNFLDDLRDSGNSNKDSNNSPNSSTPTQERKYMKSLYNYININILLIDKPRLQFMESILGRIKSNSSNSNIGSPQIHSALNVTNNDPNQRPLDRIILLQQANGR